MTMTDIPSRDALIEALMKAFGIRRNFAEEILDAILPLVLAGAGEALGPFAQTSSFFSERYLPTDAVVDICRKGEYARIEVGDLRHARAALAQINTLIGESKGTSDAR